jgi:hypothetical protein
MRDSAMLCRARDLRLVHVAAALDLGGAALQLEQLGLAGETLLVELADVPELLADQSELLRLGLDLAFDADDLLAVLGDPLLENRNLAGQRLASGLEDVGLSFDDLARLGIAAPLQQAGGKTDLGQAVALGLETGLQRVGHHPAAVQELQAGPRRGVVEADQDLSGRDLLALAHQDLADDAALQVLHRLAVAVDADHAGRDGRALQGRQRRPADEAGQEDPDDADSGDRLAAQARAGLLGEAAARVTVQGRGAAQWRGAVLRGRVAFGRVRAGHGFPLCRRLPGPDPRPGRSPFSGFRHAARRPPACRGAGPGSCPRDAGCSAGGQSRRW